MDHATAGKFDAPLRRRNSIASSVVLPSKLNLPVKPRHHFSFPSTNPSTAAFSSSYSSSSSSSSFPTVDFELISFKPVSSYTSLKDLLPTTALLQSPNAGSEISIRNRLVKQAAWAYLQPMSNSPESSGHSFFHRLWARFSGGDLLRNNPLTSLLRFLDQHIVPAITRAFHRILGAIQIGCSR